MKNILFLLVIPVIIIGCDSSRKSQNDPLRKYEVDAVSPGEYSNVRSSNPAPVPQPEVITDDNPPTSEVSLEPLDIPDSLLVSIERTPCFGSCPTYKFNVYNSGFAEFEGIRFVDSLGKFTTYLPQERLQQIRQIAEEVNYFSFNDIYDNPYITDIPAAITIVQIDGRKKRVLNRHEAPEQLFIFERYLDGIVQDLGYHRWRNREQED